MDNEQVIPATSAPADSPEGTAKKPPRPRRKPTVSAPSQDQLDVQLPAAAVDSTNDGGATAAAPVAEAAPAAEQPADAAPDGSQPAGQAPAATARTRRPRKTAAEKAAEAAAAQAALPDEATAAATSCRRRR